MSGRGAPGTSGDAPLLCGGESDTLEHPGLRAARGLRISSPRRLTEKLFDSPADTHGE